MLRATCAVVLEAAGLRPRAWDGCRGVGSLGAAKRPEIFFIGGVTGPTEPTKPGFVGSVGSTSRGVSKSFAGPGVGVRPGPGLPPPRPGIVDWRREAHDSLRRPVFKFENF